MHVVLVNKLYNILFFIFLTNNILLDFKIIYLQGFSLSYTWKKKFQKIKKIVGFLLLDNQN